MIKAEKNRSLAEKRRQREHIRFEVGQASPDAAHTRGRN